MTGLEGPPRRVARCFSVSLLTTGLSLATLAALTTSLAVTAWAANVVATAIGTVVSYHLNRRWVWSRRDASDAWHEVVPFWAMSFAGLALSTVAVAAADTWARSVHLTGEWRTLAVLTASVAGYAALWIAQFVVLERVLFAEHPARPVTPPRGPTGRAREPVAVAPGTDSRGASTFEVDAASTKERVR